MYTLVFVPEAKTEMEKEVHYSVSKWGKSHAAKYIKQLSQRIRSLTNNPYLYRTHDTLIQGLRLMTFKGNQVFYWIDEAQKRVIILGVPSIHRELSPDVLKQRLLSS